MRSFCLVFVAAVIALSAVAGSAGSNAGNESPTPINSSPAQTRRRTLRAFGSEQELASFFRELAAAQRRERERAQQQELRRRADAAGQSQLPGIASSVQETVTVTATADVLNSSSAEISSSITNVQHAGVDEGGIVKLHGNYLVVLRRGRLFTVAIGDRTLRPISAVDAFGPEIDPSDTWYDEMLISGDTVVVIGYSYERGGTEVGLFNIDRAGHLRYRSTYHLRSNDYYSSRNYSSRLIGDKLIFYTPLYLSPEAENPLASFPAVRRWRKGARDDEFRRIVSASRVYRPAQPVRAADRLALHTVTVCDLARGEMACEGTGVIGPAGRVFYVSPGAVYVWTTAPWEPEGGSERPRPMLYRMPLDGSAPSALGVSGAPVDQFSFLESADEHLNVLVRSEAVGDGMWGAEVAEGEVALLRVSLGSFADGSDHAPPASYRRLPQADDEAYAFQNRFVGEYLLYGTGRGWGPARRAPMGYLYAVRYAVEGEAAQLPLPHGVDRIEALGRDALVVGTDGDDLHFTGVRLDDRPSIAHRYTRRGASQGEERSHGFFYKPDGEYSGLLGLPIRRADASGSDHLIEDSAAILFLRNESLRLAELGELEARPERATDDGCRASCVDWYGNARPLFVRGRIFALLGYEIVEGSLDAGRIRETRRISFAPQMGSRARR